MLVVYVHNDGLLGPQVLPPPTHCNHRNFLSVCDVSGAPSSITVPELVLPQRSPCSCILCYLSHLINAEGLLGLRADVVTAGDSQYLHACSYPI